MSNFGKVYYDNKVIATLPNSCYTKTKHFNRKKVAAMGFFKKKEKAAPSGDFDRENDTVRGNFTDDFAGIKGICE